MMAEVRGAGVNLGGGRIQGPVEAGGGVVGAHGVQGAAGQGAHHQHHLLLIRHNLLRHHILTCAIHRAAMRNWLLSIKYLGFLLVNTPSGEQPCRWPQGQLLGPEGPRGQPHRREVHIGTEAR